MSTDLSPHATSAAALPAADGTTDTEEAPARLDPLAALWSLDTARARCRAVAAAVDDGRSGWFTGHPEALPALVQALTERLMGHPQGERMPPLGVWRALDHTEAATELERLLSQRPPQHALRARLDLASLAGLMAQGAGPVWSWDDSRATQLPHLALPAHRQGRDELLAMLNQASGAATPSGEAAAAGDAAHTHPPVESSSDAPPAPAARLGGTAGLAVALLRAFLAGAFSDDPADPLRVDARPLRQMDAAALRALFQSTTQNPLPGLEARVAVLQRWGATLQMQTPGHPARPCSLIERHLAADAARLGGIVSPAELLRDMAKAWAPVFSAERRVLGLPGGDVWPHLWAGAATGGEGSPPANHPGTGGWVPLHQPVQWIVAAWLESLAAAGVSVGDDGLLTALCAPSAGRLLLDSGLATPRSPRDLQRDAPVSDPWVIEWRALTLHAVGAAAEGARQRCAQRGLRLSMAQVLHNGVQALADAPSSGTTAAPVPPALRGVGVLGF